MKSFAETTYTSFDEEDTKTIVQEEEEDEPAPVESEDDCRNLRDPTDQELFKALEA